MSKVEKRDEIIRAALELIAEHGFHGAPMAMIADRAEWGRTIYRYFETRMCSSPSSTGRWKTGSPRLFWRGTRRGNRSGSDSSTWVRRCSGTSSNPLDFRYLEQFHNSPYGVEHRRDKFQGKREGDDVFRELFDQGVFQQVMKDLPLPVLFALAFGPLLAVARDHILGFIPLDDALIVRTVEACWDGVRR